MSEERDDGVVVKPPAPPTEPPGYQGLIQRVDFLEQNLKDAASHYQALAIRVEEVVTKVNTLIVKMEGFRPTRDNCRACGRAINTADKKCGICGTAQ